MAMLAEKISNLRPCDEAYKWLSTFADGEEQQAWDKCKRGDWMLWLLGKLSGPPESESRKRLVRAALACAKLTTPVKNPESEQVRQMCLKTISDYLEGTVTLDDVRKAANVAYAAAYAAADAYTAYTADAASAAAANAAYAAAAVYAAADAAADAAAYAAAKRLDVLRQCANEVRKIYPEAPRI